MRNEKNGNSPGRKVGSGPKAVTRDPGGPLEEVSEEEWESIRHDLGLSPRESEVAFQVLRGLGEKNIATVLGISPHTVHTHLGRIYKKLGIHRRSHLVVRIFQAYSELDDS
jgi:DNA-binding CsgD family transcriptional regulator